MAMIMDRKLSAMVLAFGVVVIQLLAFSLASHDLEQLNNKTETVNATLSVNGTNVSRNGEGNKSSNDTDYFGTQFKVCLVIAAILTVIAILACVVIRIKAPSHAGGERPKALVDIGGDF